MVQRLLRGKCFDALFYLLLLLLFMFFVNLLLKVVSLFYVIQETILFSPIPSIVPLFQHVYYVCASSSLFHPLPFSPTHRCLWMMWIWRKTHVARARSSNNGVTKCETISLPRAIPMQVIRKFPEDSRPLISPSPRCPRDKREVWSVIQRSLTWTS
jgi:hypothetical protein